MSYIVHAKPGIIHDECVSGKCDVVLEIVSHGEVYHFCDAHILKVCRGTHTGDHQNLC